jgi:CubicO group peptidase (beta-lactamase class C family)
VSYRAELVRSTTLPADGIEARIDSIFAPFADPAAPGCAVAAARNGVAVFAKGYGSASLEHDVSITTRTRFYAASVSKQFTAYVIALLAQQGRLSLDDDVRKWIPEVPDFGTTITVRHLIHHTSGLRDYFGLLGLTGWPGDGPITETQFLDLVGRQRALNFTPGTQHLYSNTGYVLLAILVERVTGQRLREFAVEHVFEPLGMRNTEFRDDHTRLIVNRALAYSPQAGGGWRLNVPGFDVIGDGGLFTTVEDLLRWDRHFLEPNERAATVSGMLERGRLANGESIPYAFGLVHGDYRGAPIIVHGGSYGGYRTLLMRFPQQRAAIATLCNTSAVNPGALSQQVADVLLEGELTQPPVVAAPPTMMPTPPATRAAELDSRALARFAGTYYSSELDVTWRIDVIDGGLVVRRRATADQKLEPRDTDTFSLRGGTLRFVSSEGGQVNGFTYDAGRVTGIVFTKRADG